MPDYKGAQASETLGMSADRPSGPAALCCPAGDYVRPTLHPGGVANKDTSRRSREMSQKCKNLVSSGERCCPVYAERDPPTP